MKKVIYFDYDREMTVMEAELIEELPNGIVRLISYGFVNIETSKEYVFDKSNHQRIKQIIDAKIRYLKNQKKQYEKIKEI